MKNLFNFFNDHSGQAMTEYVIISVFMVLSIVFFLNTEVLDILPMGVYRSIYLFLRGMIINAILPIP
jgi:hypothetical protein